MRKFLGFSFTRFGEPRRRIAPKAILRFKERIRELTQRTRGVSTNRMAEELAQYLRGWRGYFGKCQTPSVLVGLDQWLRRRLRSAIWKQWKRGSVRFAELRRRGVGKDLAAKTAGSAHGPWRLAQSPALDIALPQRLFRLARVSEIDWRLLAQSTEPPYTDPYVRWCDRESWRQPTYVYCGVRAPSLTPGTPN